MIQNVGLYDRIFRYVAAAAIAFLIYNNTFTGIAAWIMGTFAVTATITASIRSCPVYLPFNINTRNKPPEMG